MSLPKRITFWVCDTCGYRREDKGTGIHRATNPKDPSGPMVSHPLRKAVYVEDTGDEA